MTTHNHSVTILVHKSVEVLKFRSLKPRNAIGNDIKEEKNMRLKKVMATGLVAALALSTMVGCSSKKDSSDQKKIGVVQLVEHDALDASYKGFKDGLEKAGYKDGDKIKIEYKNAQNEQSNCQTIANNLSQISAILY